MAVLSDAERAKIHKEIMQFASQLRDNLGLTKQDLRDAINAADTWVDNNAVSYNLALPIAARNAMTAKQKAYLISAVTLHRYGVI